METCSLSEEYIKKAAQSMRGLRDEDGSPISVDGRMDGQAEYQHSMIKFTQWLRKQDDIPKRIKINSDILVFSNFVPEFVADEFKPYIEKYEREIEKEKG